MTHLPHIHDHVSASNNFINFTDQDRTWLEVAKCKMLSLVEEEKELYFHLSLVCALLGEDTEAGKYFATYSGIFEYRYFSMNPTSQNFWSAL